MKSDGSPPAGEGGRWQPVHFHALTAAGAEFCCRFDRAWLSRFRGETEPGAAEGAVTGIADLSCLPRFGVRGPGASHWLAKQGFKVPAEVNQSVAATKAFSAMRLSGTEFFVVARLDAEWDTVFSQASKFEASLRQMGSSSSPADPGQTRDWGHVHEVSAQACWPRPRQDSHVEMLVFGAESRLMLAKMCAVDLGESKRSEGSVVQTSLARINAIICIQALGSRRFFRIFVDSAYSQYMLDVLHDVGIEYEAKYYGLDFLSTHLRNSHSARGQRT